MDKFIGKTLNDRYILTEIIGIGGMAVVYKAFDRVVNRVVAVKILKEEFMSDAQFRRRFTNESKAITMLSQENIVDVYDVYLEGDLMYLVMEYIDGITLKEYIDKKGFLDWKEASFYIKQILKAMSHAHERGIVHRDLKPHNIMLLRDGTIKVTDFGIAKLSKFDTQTITDKAIGSVHYISPEQASGDRTDSKTDIYSVGVMYYEMLTGSLPFTGDSPVSVALMHVQEQPKLPREIRSDIPAGAEEIVIKAMMKNPDDRYTAAIEMFNDILAVEKDENTVFGYIDLGEDDVTIAEDYSSDVELELEDDDFDSDVKRVDDTNEYSEESKFKAIWLPIICGVGTAILAVLIVVLGVIYFPELKDSIFKSNDVVEMVTVQNYVGQNFETVSQENATGLIFEKVNVLSDKPAGEILSQEPAANTEVEKGSIVTFNVSTGVETVQIPDISDKYYQVALAELFDLGISYKTSYISSETVKKDYVIKTDPKSFTEIKSDSTITVYISTGPEIVTVEVPDLVDRNVDDAVSKLSELNLKADKLYEYHDTVPEDCVISQGTEAGTLVEEGEIIEIVISKGPAPTDENPDDSKEPDDTTNPDGSTTPGGDTTEPDDSTNPDSNTPNPDGTTTPDSNTPNPDGTTTPDGNTPNPDGTTTPDNETSTTPGGSSSGNENNESNTGNTANDNNTTTTP